MTLTTDFGLRDSYVAEMKGQILALCPDATLVDVSHDVPPGDIAGGAFVLERAARAFPPGTVHLAVVDPGVGGPRRALAARTAGGFAVGPDNGLLAPLLQDHGVVALTGPDDAGAVSATFHGRDIFAPAAARLARGDDLDTLGEAVHDPHKGVDLGAGAPRILHVDHFGNCVTSLAENQVPPGGSWQVQVGARLITRRVTTYSQADPGEAVLLMGSDGRMEIALRDGNAALALGLQTGMELKIHKPHSHPPGRENDR